MAKEAKVAPLKDNGEPLISTDSEVETVIEAMLSDVEDLVNIIQEKGWQEAIDSVSSIQEGLDALLPFLQGKE